MNGFARRGACPTLLSPMPTGDGLLARLHTIDGGFSPKALAGLCQSARRHGNGIIDVSARGSLQIRGLTSSSAQALGREVEALDIDLREGVPVETGPLAGLDRQEIADPRPLAAKLRLAIDKTGLAARLGPKVSVAVDGGGMLPMDAITADIRLVACCRDDAVAWHLAIAGTAQSARPLGLLTETQAGSAAIAILEAIAALGRTARARDLIDPYKFIAEIPLSGLPERIDLQAQPTGTPIAMFPLVDGTRALGLALPYGSMPAESLDALARQAASLGITEIRPAARSLLFCSVSAATGKKLRQAAAALGFITDAADPRLSIAACPGAPACASGRIATRALAQYIAARHADLLDGSFTLHISGCAKGCAHPAPAALTIIGHDGGTGIALEATAGDASAEMCHASGAQAGIAHIASLVRNTRHSGESVAACLARLGAATLTTAFTQERQ